MHYSLELYLISAWCFLVLQPLYNQPSDLPCYHENLRRWDSQTLSVVLIIATIMQPIEVKQNDLYLKNYYCYQASKVYLYLLPVYVKSDGNIVIVLFVTRFMTSQFFIQQFVGRLHWNICLVVHPNIIRYWYLIWTSECWHDLPRGLPLLAELCLGDSC